MENERGLLKQADIFFANTECEALNGISSSQYGEIVSILERFAKSEAAKQYWQEQLKQPVKTLEEVGLYLDDFNRSYCSKIGGLVYCLRPHQMTPDQLRAIANHIEQTNKTPTK